MNRHQMTRIVQRHSKKLRLLSKKAAANFSVEDIHDLRVEAKMLRAFLRLAGGDDSPLPKEIRRIYKAMGEVRNLQLLRRRLLAIRSTDAAHWPENFFDHLDGRLITIKQETRNLIDNCVDLKKHLRHSLSGLPVRVGKARQAAFVQSRIGLSQPATTAVVEQLHTLRKALKDLLYAWPYLDNPARRQAAAHFGRYPAIKAYAQLLGDFLDSSFQLKLLEDRSLFTDNLAPLIVDDLRRRWATREDILLRGLDKTLHIRLQLSAPALMPLTSRRRIDHPVN